MGEQRTPWHHFFGLLLAEKAPRCFEVQPEVALTQAVQRIDYLLLRRRPWEAPPDRGETLVDLWPELPRVTIGEYKSAVRQYRRGEIHRLLGYGHQYASEHVDELIAAELAVALLVASRNEALDDDLRRLGARERSLGGGYTRVEGLFFPLLLVDLTGVARRDRDDFVALFAEQAPIPVEAKVWWYAHFGTRTEVMMDAKQMEEFRALERRFIDSLPIEDRLAGLDPMDVVRALKPEQRLAGLGPEQRLAGLGPEQRLAGLTDAEAVLAMPDAVLAGLTEAFVDALPDDVRARVRARRAAR